MCTRKKCGGRKSGQAKDREKRDRIDLGEGGAQEKPNAQRKECPTVGGKENGT